MSILAKLDTAIEFADDPIASHSAQFGLARPIDTPVGHSAPSPVGVRPWNLRGAEVLAGAADTTTWRYDHELQIAVTPDGLPLTAMAEPTAKSITNLDGDEGPNEDWTYDFHPDQPGSPV